MGDHTITVAHMHTVVEAGVDAVAGADVAAVDAAVASNVASMDFPWVATSI